MNDDARAARRRSLVPTISYPPDLPVSAARDEIAAAIASSQVVVVAGETGSGKTTQLPKICLELGRGVHGTIGHTQPRRIAARSVAERIAEELGTTLGEAVGYKVRFTDRSSDDTLVKVMTDGILLAELQSDRLLRRYDTIIVDEAHERSLNIDFLLGYLTQLLPKRPDLKLVITSATIETARFSQHFGGAPVIEVTGRTYPVEVRYRPPDEELDQPQAIASAVDELCAEGQGDVLVFLSGEREIRDTAEVLRGSLPDHVEVLPLYARLSAAEQHRVFEQHQQRRVVLATNVAETSLTVPGIRYVVDPGTARISRYSQRLKVQRLPIERISRASADQRAGRCGRVAPGIAIRLYDEEDLASRPEFTEPEVLRTSLASVILQMTSIGLGDVEAFPFVEPPDRRAVKDGKDLLYELGALDPVARDVNDALTPMGRTLARMPVDPRLARMVVEADRLGCLPEVLVLVAAMSIQDVRERPSDKQQAAAEQHARFADPTSDYLSVLRLWDHVRELRQELSSSAFRRRCRSEFLHHQRIREWQDLHSQLRSVCRQQGMALDTSRADDDRIHQALLAGLLSHVGLREGERRDYLGARGARFSVVRDSAVAKSQPRWVMAAELVETNRLWGRMVAKVQPEWVEQLAGHLVVRVYSEPHWSRKRAGAQAYERVTLYGIPLVAQRRVDYGRIDPETARDLFLRHALVEGEWDTHHAFFAANQALLGDVEALEERARRRDLVVGVQAVYDFYDSRIPADVVSGRHFDAWWKDVRRDTPDLLTMRLDDLLSAAAVDVTPGDYPSAWSSGDLVLELDYAFDPGADDDGVAVEVPVEVLNRLVSEDFQWQVPGLRQELVTALLKSLPKQLRVKVGPAPDAAREILARVDPRQEELLPALERELRVLRGLMVRREDWQWERVPGHLRTLFRVVDAAGEVLGEGRDLAALQTSLAPRVAKALSSAVSIEVAGLTAFPAEPVPVEVSDGAVRGYPALVDEGASVALRVLPTPAAAEAAHRLGVRRLLLLGVPSPVRGISDRLTTAQKLALSRNPHGSVTALLDDVVVAAVDGLVQPVRIAADFAAQLASVKEALPGSVATVVASTERVLSVWHELTAALAAETRPPLRSAVADMTAQVSALVGPGFVAAVGAGRLRDVERYLRGVLRRLDRLPRDPVRDGQSQRRVEAVEQERVAFLTGVPRTLVGTPAVEELRWMVEELRVSLFAPDLKTRYPVSEQRIYKAMDAISG
ncbi:MAG: ATP-dependent RNA helicase HrpA [Mycobacteriales bacterium]|nr:ATP-dependent RNA helicase HrpA [Mycobacteriales bacterium]